MAVSSRSLPATQQPPAASAAHASPHAPAAASAAASLAADSSAGAVALPRPRLPQLLACKLGSAASSLLIGVADKVIAHMLWFQLDGLEGFTGFVEDVVKPETFIAVVKVCWL